MVQKGVSWKPMTGGRGRRLQGSQHQNWTSEGKRGCFYKLGLLVAGALALRILFLQSILGAPDFWKLPCVFLESQVAKNKGHCISK